MNLYLNAVALGTLFLLSSGCNTSKEKPSTPSAALANPASVRCIDDGYQLIKIDSETSITGQYICVNPDNNKQCDPWAYYRGQCDLK